MYFEVEFQNPVDLIRASREARQQIFVDEQVNPLQSKYWFAIISEQGSCCMNSCTTEQAKMDLVLENIRRTGNLSEQVPEPVPATFAQVK
jgi:hypothetical protein